MDPLLNPFDYISIPFGDWAEAALNWIVGHSRESLLAAKLPVQRFLEFVQAGLEAIPPLLGILVATIIGWALGGVRLAVTGFICLTLIGLMGAWQEAMTTLSIVIASVMICILLGLPIGVLAARSDQFFRILRPLLDLLQTIPSFVYLVPVIMLFGSGSVAGLIASVLYAAVGQVGRVFMEIEAEGFRMSAE